MAKAKKAKKKTRSKWKADRKPPRPGSDPGGQPTKYRSKFPEMLEKHMAEGGSFCSFGGVVRATEPTLYNWADAHPQFQEAKDLGELLSLKFYEDIAKASMTGSLRRIAQEEYARDENGRVIFQDGKPMISKRIYATTRGDASSWGITMRSRFRKFGYANRVELTGKNGGPIKTKTLSDLSDDELDKRLEKLREHDTNKP